MSQVGEAPFPASAGALVSSRVVRGLLRRAEQAGVSQLKVLEAAQLDPARLVGLETRLPRPVVYRVLEVAVELTGDPALGLHWVEQLDSCTFAPISHLLDHCATLRQAFETLAEGQPLLSDQLGYELAERGGQVTIHCLSLEHESPVTQRFTSEMIVVGLYRLVRLFNPRCALDRVGFAYPAPDYRGEYERILGGPVSFDQPRTSFMFDGALMSSASPFRDPDLHDALRALVQRRVLLLSESTPYALRARDHLARHDAPHQLDMASVARSLGLSERSLRRRLAEEGTAYDALQDEACGIVVQRLLLERRCTIQEAAFEMGFTSTTAFHRAFKRWTGMTPSAFRASRTSLRQTTA